MAQQLYEQFKRTGAYTLFVDESELTRTNTGDTAIHLLIGQSRYGSAPVNTLVRIQDAIEFENTFGKRDRFMERKGNYFVPMAKILLQQAPIFVLNIQSFDDTKQKVDAVTLKPNTDGQLYFDSVKQVPLTSVYDRNGFWKVDRELMQPNIKAGELISFNTFNTKGGSLIVKKADMSNTEFANITVAEYNANNKDRPIDCVGGATKMADLFFQVDLFNSKIVKDLKSNFNPALATYLKADATNATATILGDTAQAQTANYTSLKNLPTANFVQSYVGTIIPNVFSSLNDAVALDKVFNADAKLHGIVCALNEDLIEDWAIMVDDGDITEINEYLDKFKASGTTPPTPAQIFDINGAVQDNDQLVDGTRARQNEILDLLTTRGLKSGILNYKANDFFYILDSFKTYLEPNSKWQIAKLAEESKRFAYLYSAPFIKDFAREETYQDANGVFDSKFIPQGGNPAVSDPVLYSMPQKDADICTFPFAGGLIYNDGTTDVAIPTSVAGAIAYGAKHLSANKKPYSIINGPINGLVSMINVTDVAYSFTDYDLDQLEAFGWNMILKSDTVFQITNDATAKNLVKSSLSFASNYELVTHIAREGRKVLEKLVGERNNDATRLRAKTGLDAITNRLRAEGVIERAVNTCDLTNNTAQVRTAGILLADTEIWTADGIRIAVHRINVKLKSDNTGLLNQ